MQPIPSIGVVELLIIGSCCLSLGISVIALSVIIVLLIRKRVSD